MLEATTRSEPTESSLVPLLALRLDQSALFSSTRRHLEAFIAAGIVGIVAGSPTDSFPSRLSAYRAQISPSFVVLVLA